MEITDIRVRFSTDHTDRLKAFAAVTFDEVFVVRDVKIVEGTNGLFVAMPSRRTSVACAGCGHRNQIKARYCEHCGHRMPPPAPIVDAEGRSRIHRDIAHPITTEFRELLHKKVLDAYHQLCEEGGAPEPVEMDDQGLGEMEEREDDIGNTTEYDDLIAGLNPGNDIRDRQYRGGPPRSPVNRESRPPVRRDSGHHEGGQGRAPRSGGGGTQGQGSREDRGGSRGGRGPGRREDRPPRNRGPEDRGRGRPASSPRGPTRSVPHSDHTGRGTAAPPVDLPKPATPPGPPKHAADDDDAAPFGEGIV